MSDTGRRSPARNIGTAGEDIDERRLKYVFYAASLIGGLVILNFAFRHLNSDNLALKYSLFAASIGVYLTFLYVYISKKIHTGAIASSIVIASLALALVITGGHENTGLHWVYPLLFIQFIFLGAFRGLIYAILLLLMMSAILAAPDLVPANYSSAEISRSLAAVATLVLLCFVSEYFRQRSHQAISSQHTAKMVEAVTDPLTGLTNRRFLDAFYFPDCKRMPESHFPLAVIVCDVDNFKAINDENGHMVGDKVLRYVARLLSESIRSNDVVSRIGGEEFLVLAQNADIKAGTAIAEKLRHKIEELDIRELDHNVTGSFGVAICQRFEQLNSTIDLADQCMYEAKKGGRNQVVSATEREPTPEYSPDAATR